MKLPLNWYSEDDTDLFSVLKKIDLGMFSDVKHIKVVH